METIANEFATALSGTHRITESWKKNCTNIKRDTRKITAQEKIELHKTSGGRLVQKLLDPTYEYV